MVDTYLSRGCVWRLGLDLLVTLKHTMASKMGEREMET